MAYNYRKYITKSKSGHYTATVRFLGLLLFKEQKLSSKEAANSCADKYILSQIFFTAGFTEWETGGGCTAYGKRVEPNNGDKYVLITHADGGSVPTSVHQPMLVGYYDHVADTDCSKEVANLGEALEAAEDYITAANHS